MSSNAVGYAVGRFTPAGIEAITDDELREKCDLRGGRTPSMYDDVRIEDVLWAARQADLGRFQWNGGDSLNPYFWALSLTLPQARRELLEREEAIRAREEDVALAEAAVRLAERKGADLFPIRRDLYARQAALSDCVSRNEADVAALRAVIQAMTPTRKAPTAETVQEPAR